MDRTIVIYQSKYGSTKKYANWLAQMLQCEAVEKKQFNAKHFDNYDTIIYGGGIYAKGIAGLSLIKKNISKLNNKRVVCFAVGASPFNEAAFNELKQKNFTDEIKGIKCFYCRGAFDEEKMKGGDKLLVGMLKKMVSKKDPAEFEPWEAALMESIGQAGQAGDWTDKENLMPLIDYIRSDT